MEKKNALTKVLAILGTFLVWFPILAPIVLSLALLITRGRFLFDYLLPAELFLFALVGSGLLLWATVRAHIHVKLIAWGFGIAVLVLFGGQELAVVSGLASGETEPAGWIWVVVLASLAIYSLGIIVVGTGGALLLQDLFKRNLSSYRDV